MHWIYGVRIDEEDGDFVVTVRDLPEVVTSGDSREEALELAKDAIEVVIAKRIEHERELPPPSQVRRAEQAVALAPHLAAKASVYALWKKAGISKRELARRIGRQETEARRILDPRFGTKLEQLGEAAEALGGKLVVGLA